MRTTLLLVVAAAALSPALGEEQASIAWRTDLDGARAEAKRSGRPLLIVFR